MDIGIIGLGGAGRAHFQRFRRNPAVRRIVGYDIRPEAAAEAGCESAGSLEELLAQVNAVSICTPDHLHLEGIIAALQAGRHVLVEKPMVASHEEPKRWVRSFARSRTWSSPCTTRCAMRRHSSARNH